MTKQRATYKTATCLTCGTPVAIHSSGEGTIYATPLYIDARDRVTLALELEREHAWVLRLRVRIDALVIERDRLARAAQIALTDFRQQRDSARKWAARWKRCARRALYGGDDPIPVSTTPPPARWTSAVVVERCVRPPLIIEEEETTP